MAICGAFAGLAGAVQVLGVNYAIPASDVPVIDIGFTGIAVALLGRNTASGVVLAALLFAALQSGGTQLSGSFSPELASSVSNIIQGTIILLVGGELIVRWLVARAKRERGEPLLPGGPAPPAQSPRPQAALRCDAPGADRPRPRSSSSCCSSSCGARRAPTWPRSSRRGCSSVPSSTRRRSPSVRSAGLYSERSGVVNIGLEGMMLMGCFWGVWVVPGQWLVGARRDRRDGGGRLLGLVHAVLSIHLRANQVISGTAVNILGLGITSYGLNAIFGSEGSGDVPRIPSVLHFLEKVPLIGDVIGGLNLMIYLALALVDRELVVPVPHGLGTAAAGRRRAPASGGHGRHPRVPDPLHRGHRSPGVLAGMGGAYLAFGLGSQFSENMTAGRGFIALAALIFGKWKPFGLLAAALLFGFSQALGDALQTILHVNAFLVFTLPYILTLVALVGVVGRSRGPAAAGIPYARQ